MDELRIEEKKTTKFETLIFCYHHRFQLNELSHENDGVNKADRFPTQNEKKIVQCVPEAVC